MTPAVAQIKAYLEKVDGPHAVTTDLRKVHKWLRELLAEVERLEEQAQGYYNEATKAYEQRNDLKQQLAQAEAHHDVSRLKQAFVEKWTPMGADYDPRYTRMEADLDALLAAEREACHNEAKTRCYCAPSICKRGACFSCQIAAAIRGRNG